MQPNAIDVAVPSPLLMNQVCNFKKNLLVAQGLNTETRDTKYLL